jgi:hypothetical protein
MSEGFFDRWSRRKQALQAKSEASTLPVTDGAPAAQPPAQERPSAEQATQAVVSVPESPAALPTLQDARALTTESDFQPFMQSGVATEVRNAAMKKLFADPHFNVMDGLDIYIEDYNLPDPMPVGMLQKMASAQFLNLVPPEDGAKPALTGGEVVAQSPGTSASADPPNHDDPDLQLQPDPSPAAPAARPGAG